MLLNFKQEVPKKGKPGSYTKIGSKGARGENKK
jgi:hypothetical protein